MLLPILMTASVSTRGMKGASYTDEEREKMYVDTLNYYLSQLIEGEKIVFAENSGWSYESIKAKIECTDTDKVEFISLNPDMFDIAKGKGYNELLLINMAIEKSLSIQQSGAFFKVTGRYPIKNLQYFLKKASKMILQEGYEFYGDMKDHKLYEWLRTGWCGHSGEARLFGCNISYFREKLGCRYMELNDYEGRLVEGLLFDVMKSSLANGEKVSCRFNREPIFSGFEGSIVNAITFTKNQNSYKAKFKRFVGNAIRLFTPWFKF